MNEKNMNDSLGFEQILRATQEELKNMLAFKLKQMGYQIQSKDGYLYANGTVPVLLVAHLDTVHKTPVKYICYSDNGEIAMSPEGIGGDDRCGVYMILKIISQAPCHVLFCEDEEIGCIGAQKFTHSSIYPQVNYIVEMDRRGSNDAVFYDCANPEFTEFICSFGFQEEFGSCSDISFIAPYMGIAAVNISCGYYHEHRLHEYINMQQMERNADRICEMVLAVTDRFEYREEIYSFSYAGTKDYANYSIWDYMDSSSNNRTSMMRLPEDVHVFMNRQKMNCQGHYYLDHKGNVYDYLPQLKAAILCEGMSALMRDGAPVKYLCTDSTYVKVITLEKAMELLQAG